MSDVLNSGTKRRHAQERGVVTSGNAYLRLRNYTAMCGARLVGRLRVVEVWWWCSTRGASGGVHVVRRRKEWCAVLSLVEMRGECTCAEACVCVVVVEIGCEGVGLGMVVVMM